MFPQFICSTDILQKLGPQGPRQNSLPLRDWSSMLVLFSCELSSLSVCVCVGRGVLRGANLSLNDSTAAVISLILKRLREKMARREKSQKLSVTSWVSGFPPFSVHFQGQRSKKEQLAERGQAKTWPKTSKGFPLHPTLPKSNSKELE